jgi:catechol 2,3-dioxygenase-like lactoylglutathione lyase family enzyme
VTPHHVGCALRDLAAGQATYANSLGLRRKTRAFAVSSQQVSVSFLELTPGFYLELVSPADEAANLANYLKVGFYHLCFLTDDLDEARTRLKARRFSALPAFESEAFDGARCQFFVSPERHLIELAGMSPAAFDRFFAANVLPDL